MVQDSGYDEIVSDVSKEFAARRVSLEGFCLPGLRGERYGLADCLWSPTNSFEDVLFGGPYHEAVDAFIEQGEISRGRIRRFLCQLEPREEKVIRLRFGIGERTDHTHQEAGGVIGLTSTRILQIEMKAMRKLSKAMLNYAARDALLSKAEKASIEQKLQKIAGATVKKPKDPMSHIQKKIARQFWVTHHDLQLIGQLNGWYGRKKTSFADVAAKYGMSWEEQAVWANVLMTRLRLRGVWPDAPVYRLFETIYWID